MEEINGAKKFQQIKAEGDDCVDYHNNERYEWDLAYLP